MILQQTKDTWEGLSGWVKLVAAIGAAVTVLSQCSGLLLRVTLDDRYVLAADSKSYVTQSDLVAQSRQLNQQIGQIRKDQLQNERRRLRDELYRLKAQNRPENRQRILQLEDDIKDIDRDLRRLEQGR